MRIAGFAKEGHGNVVDLKVLKWKRKSGYMRSEYQSVTALQNDSHVCVGWVEGNDVGAEEWRKGETWNIERKKRGLVDERG